MLFIFMSACVAYILYCSITKTYNWYLLSAISFVFLEGLVLVLNKWQCPLTDLAKEYGDKEGSVTQYFCPRWFVPHVFQTFTVLYFAGIVVLIIRYI